MNDHTSPQSLTITIDEFYIQALSPRAATRVLKSGDLFAVFDRAGNIVPAGLREQGIYFEGTRFLSGFELRLGSGPAVLLSSTVTEENALLAVHLTNPDIYCGDQLVVPRGTIHIARSIFLWEGTCYERLSVRNYGLAFVETTLTLSFEADFVDVFEVRGVRRERRGRFDDVDANENRAILEYEGLDGVLRRTTLQWSLHPSLVADHQVQFDASLNPGESLTLDLTTTCDIVPAIQRSRSFDRALTNAKRVLTVSDRQDCEIQTSNEQFNDWMSRSLADLRMMITDTPYGPVPYAGVPWFSTPFGRDAIITALQCLWINPSIARGVLSYLAATQARDEIAERDAQPGKILHETRKGEMAALDEVPFGQYYGSVDSTPLFIMLAGAYFARTADRDFVESIWPNIVLALEWLDRYGDRDDDGFVEYEQKALKGLRNQGWKDSGDAIFHKDGGLADGPIALCEVQAYTYAAKRHAAILASVLGNEKSSVALDQEAQRLRRTFDGAFWSDSLGSYALALDGDKQPCLVRSSNAGHCLFAGIARKDRAQRLARTLLDPASSFSGWGIRTIASLESRYNPMSYHNGSIWPHDNSLIAIGLAQYGLTGAASTIMSGFFNASVVLDLHRLPELICGFDRHQGEAPTLYPVACAPQAWSSGSALLFLRACLGLSINVPQKQLRFAYPRLPDWLQTIRIRRLVIGDASIDLRLEQHPHDVGITVERREGDVEITTVT